MTAPVAAQNGPFAVGGEADESSLWCACWRGANQPFCAGAYKGVGFSPIKWQAEKAKTAYFAETGIPRIHPCAMEFISSFSR